METKISREQAKRFFLSRQGLLGHHRFVGREGVFQYVRQAGCIQYDPVDVCGKNAELTLQSRVKGFTKKTLADLLYRDRRLVDYCDKELSIWPSEDWPYFAPYRQKSIAHGQSFPEIPALEKRAIAYIRENGPVSSDTLPIEGKIFWHSSIHWSGNWEKQSQAARSVLEQLYTDGVLLIHHKSGSRKFYDLAEKYLDAALLQAENPCPDELDYRCWRILRRIGAVGMLWNRPSNAWLGIEMTTAQRLEAFSLLEEERRILPVRIEGISAPLFLLAQDLPLLEKVCRDEVDTKARLEFLAPLDPMLWDRRLIEDIWGFPYSWEISTPAEKRKFGYYVLPMLYGENLIGRIEAAAERRTGTLLVKNIWFEDGVRQTKRLDAAIDVSLRRLARFNDCTQMTKL